jgi:ABC-2 type transport system permease protein
MVDKMLISRDFLKEYFKLHIKTAMEYKFNFVMQVIFMILNNAAFTLFWIVVFSHLDEINGWVLSDFLALFALAAISYGVGSFFLGNWRDLNEIIADGKLDFYMVLPKDVLAHTLVSKSFFSAVGDVIFGIILFFLAVPFTLINVFYLVLFSIGGALILVSLSVIMNCASFWFGRSTQTSYAFLNLAY